MKLLASDFDGTFFLGIENKKLLMKNIEAASRFQRDNAFAIVSGRDAASILHHFKNTGFKTDYLACYNGARILDSKGNVLYSDPLKIDFDRLIKAAADEKALNISIMSLTKVYHRCFHFRMKNWLFLKRLFKVSDRKCVKRLEDLDDTVYMCSVSCQSEKDALDLTQKLEALKLGCSIYTNCTYIDIVGKNASKKHAVEIIGEHAQSDEVYVIGDSYNDLGMIKHFHSFTLDSANTEIQKAADHVVESVSAAVDYILEQQAR